MVEQPAHIRSVTGPSPVLANKSESKVLAFFIFSDIKFISFALLNYSQTSFLFSLLSDSIGGKNIPKDLKMKKNLTAKEYIYVASMLFGLFFGAGNLIFPVHMGQEAGRNFLPAVIGFVITGVGLPLLGVAALGASNSDGLYSLSSKVNPFFAIFFTSALYLTIGPFFAIPRCATTSFTVGIEHLLPEESNTALILFFFSLSFFVIALIFSLYPSKILTWVGKILNPFFLLFLSILIIVSLIDPSTSINTVEPTGMYSDNSFFKGFLEGYNTMDALASLAFGIIVVTVIKELGVSKAADISRNTILSGLFSCLLMAVIYLLITLMGVQSRGLFSISANGGIALAEIAHYYLGTFGFVILSITITLACLKTSIGLITACSETFSTLFKKGPSYKAWVIIFTLFSFLISNVGLTKIIDYSVPVLMFLYPYAISLALLALFGRLYNNDKIIYNWVIAFVTISSIFDFLNSLPKTIKDSKIISLIVNFLGSMLPFSELGLGWVIPSLIGLLLAIVHYQIRKRIK